jgi:putative ABC transport system permease protein
MNRLLDSLRIVLRHKRFAALAILSLSLAIALNTTMYSVLDALIYPKVDMHEPERLYTLGYYGDYSTRMTAEEKYEGIKALSSLEAVGGRVRNFGMTDDNLVERGSKVMEANIVTVTDNFFTLIGVRPVYGRLLSPADASTEPRPVVISQRLWKQFFPERPRLDTATLLVAGEPRAVVGVLSHESDFPGAYVDLWQLPKQNQPLNFRLVWGLVRLRKGVSAETARAELRALADRWATAIGEAPKDVDFRLTPAIEGQFRFQAFHMAMIAAVIAVLLVACTNLANLQLARGITRAREFATRAAVGASRRDIVVQLLLESAWLAVGGLLVGLVLTVWGMRLVDASVPRSMSELILRPQVSWRLFGFAAAATGVCVVLVGLLPAIRISRVDINEVLKSGAGTGRSVGARRKYGALVVVQVGLALALMVGGVLLIRSASSLYNLDIPPHFETVMFGSMRVAPSPTAPLDPRKKKPIWSTREPRRDPRRLFAATAPALARIRAHPNVAAAAVGKWRSPTGLTISLADPGGQAKQIITGQRFNYMVVSAEYPTVTGMTLHKGRLFQPGEFAEPLVIVDEQTARFLWPGQDAVGKRIKLARDTARAPWLEVIGVVRYVNYWRPYDRTNQEERMASRMGMVMVLNGADSTIVGDGDGVELVVSARQPGAVQKLPLELRTAIADPGAGVSLFYMRSWRQATRLDWLRERATFVASLFTVFALVALGVAALGVYAIVSHSVSQRTREFGVRIAMGASTRDIRRSVLQEGNILALTGIAIGLILAARTVGWLQAFLRTEEDRYDSHWFAVAALVLFATALVAAWVPARRAMRINAVEALKND